MVAALCVFSSCGHRRLPAVASLVAEPRLSVRGLSSGSTRAWLPRGMWDPSKPGLELVSPAPAGGFLPTVPPGKSRIHFSEQCREVGEVMHIGVKET